MIRKICSTLVILLTIISAFLINSSASCVRVYDEDGFASEDIDYIESVLLAAEEECGVPIRVYMYDAVGDDLYSHSYMLSHFGMDTDDDVVLLVITKESTSSYLSPYFYELITYGDGYRYISDSAADRILDDDGVYSIKNRRFADGIAAFADITSREILGGREAAQHRAVFVPISLALVAGAVCAIIIVYRYKRKLKSPIYPLSNYARMNLTYSRDDFVTSHVSRVRINTSSGGSGGGSRGGSRGKR